MEVRAISDRNIIFPRKIFLKIFYRNKIFLKIFYKNKFSEIFLNEKKNAKRKNNFSEKLLKESFFPKTSERKKFPKIIYRTKFSEYFLQKKSFRKISKKKTKFSENIQNEPKFLKKFLKELYLRKCSKRTKIFRKLSKINFQNFHTFL